LNKFVLRTRPQPFLLEMPPYRRPRLRDIFWRMWERAREFLVRAGTVIVAMTIIIWALVYFPRPAEVREQIVAELSALNESAAVERAVAAAYLEQSYLARAGRAVQPLFAPAGFDWKITVGVLASFPAREVIIATLGTIYGMGQDIDEGSDDLRAALARDLWTHGERAGNTWGESVIFDQPWANDCCLELWFALLDITQLAQRNLLLETGDKLLLESSSGGTAYTLACDAGAFTIAGQDAALVYTPAAGPTAYSLNCEAGAFVISGQDAQLVWTRQDVADTHDGYWCLRSALYIATSGPWA
jgi:hypothetical protein